MRDLPRYKIAVIGGGVAGITASYYLSRQHEVTLYESDSRLGGHTNTVTVEDKDLGQIGVDTGFIVCNDRTYPLFHEFLSELKVPIRYSDMSFAYYDSDTRFGYSATSFKGMFPKISHLFNLQYLKMLSGFRNFSRLAVSSLEREELGGITLRDFLEKHRISSAVRDLYVVPMGAAIWSSADNRLLDTPAETFLSFFKNHGLLNLNDRPRWQTVVGGSHSYLAAFKDQFQGEILLNSKVVSVKRKEGVVKICSLDDDIRQFDIVVIAVHADLVKGVLSDNEITAEESDLFSKWKYHENYTVLHTDTSVMPADRNIWASWNYTKKNHSKLSSSLACTYHMNRLQGLKSKTDYLVTLNPNTAINPSKIIASFNYSHPCYTLDSVATVKKIRSFNGNLSTFYCGSYHGYGFHEDAVRSARSVSDMLLGANSIEFEKKRHMLSQLSKGNQMMDSISYVH